jgi:hypothetical protein
MREWSPKKHGFESGGCGERSFNKTINPPVMSFHEWRSGLLAKLAKENIPVHQELDGTIIAKFGTFSQPMNPGLQLENYYRYLDQKAEELNQIEETEFPYEEAAGLA